MKIIDTHQHLILRDHLKYSWTEAVPELNGDFDRSAYQAVIGNEIAATVYMESGVDDEDYKSEARLVSTMVGNGNPPMLGQISSCRPEVDHGFEQWLEECQELNVVGLRRATHDLPDEVSQSEKFRTNIRRIGASGWPVDLCFSARQLGLVADLVSFCPEVHFMLDHCGTNDMRPGEIEQWTMAMKQFAGFPNLWVKFSGMTAYVSPAPTREEAVRRVAGTVLELFGPKRLVWGGDWPVVNLSVGLQNWIEESHSLLKSLSKDEVADVFSRNAIAFYRLGTEIF
jgi:predicted TIM-barrel fold metal-dependent hydrolase